MDFKEIHKILENQASMMEHLLKVWCPSDASLSETLSNMTDAEVEGIYRWGSKKGKQLAKIECLKRGIIKKPLLDRLIETLNKFIIWV